jgi:hypothetical protein
VFPIPAFIYPNLQTFCSCLQKSPVTSTCYAVYWYMFQSFYVELMPREIEMNSEICRFWFVCRAHTAQ